MTWRSVVMQAVVSVVATVVVIGGCAAFVWFHFRPTPPAPSAPPPVISIAATIKAPVGQLTKIPVECNGAFKSWTNLCKCSDVEQVGAEMWIVPHKPGTFDLIVWTCKDGPSEAGVCVVTAGDGPVPPDPPVPPTPPVPPPPPPPPPPDPAPIPAAGFRVLVVYDTDSLGKLPPAQRDILYADQLRNWLASKCVKGADGTTSEYRFLDPSTDMSHESQLWQDALKRSRKSLPWLVVSNGKTGTEQPLPSTVDETLKVLAKYAE